MPDGAQDAINLRTLLDRSGVKFAARISNLPTPSAADPADRPIAGQPYLIKYDLEGKELNRFAIWDDNAATTGPIAEVDVIEPPADAALITAKAGQKDVGKAFTTGSGTTATITLTAVVDGSIKGEVVVPGKDYAIGDFVEYPAGNLSWGPTMTGATRVVVTRLGGPVPLGGWRFVDFHTWVKDTQAAPDHAYGMEKGDAQFTTEKDSEELKVWTGTTWKTIVSTTDIKGWIAALSLFEGTVMQQAATHIPGTITVFALPDLESTDPADLAAALAKVSHYWTWTGQAGYTMHSGDPNGLGRDLDGAILQVGDWLQIANRGTPAAPNLRWVHIGGDLLARSRADVLYGLKAWVAGNYEKGSLINYKGALYRATANVTTTDTEPGTKAVAAVAGVPAGPGGVPPAVPAVAEVKAAPWELIPLTAGVHNVPTDSDLPATAPPEDVYLVLNSTKAGNKPGLFSYDPGTTAWVQLGGGDQGKTLDLSAGNELRSVGVPVGSIMMWMFGGTPPGWLLCDGATFTAAEYPELALMIPSLKLPDLRGAYLRGAGLNGTLGWGDAANIPGEHQEDATRLPRAASFTVDSQGNHTHTTDSQGVHSHTVDSAGAHRHALELRATNDTQNLIEWSKPSAGGKSSSNWNADGGSTTSAGAHVHTMQNAGAHTHTAQSAGAHTHTVTGGGDTETRPKTLFTDFIIKAFDQSITLVF